ncbi:Uncharacterised protein [Mycobacteroides abscessus subsp. abscessus]|nr:Uncharacterised protein [Mycobacteroides abscessus subsp. abscessus]
MIEALAPEIRKCPADGIFPEHYVGISKEDYISLCHSCSSAQGMVFPEPAIRQVMDMKNPDSCIFLGQPFHDLPRAIL